MKNKLLNYILCVCLVLIGLSASGGNIQLNNVLTTEIKQRKAVYNNNENPNAYKLIEHKYLEPTPDELKLFIIDNKDWLYNILDSHKELNYVLFLSNDGTKPIAISTQSEICSLPLSSRDSFMYSPYGGIAKPASSNTEYLKGFIKYVYAETLEAGNDNAIKPKSAGAVIQMIFDLELNWAVEYVDIMVWKTLVFENGATLVRSLPLLAKESKTPFGLFLSLLFMIVWMEASDYLNHKFPPQSNSAGIINEDKEKKNYQGVIDITNSTDNWLEFQNSSSLGYKLDEEYKMYNFLYIPPESNCLSNNTSSLHLPFSFSTFSKESSVVNNDDLIKQLYYREINGNSSSSYLYAGTWSVILINNFDSAYTMLTPALMPTAIDYNGMHSCDESKNVEIANLGGFGTADSNINIIEDSDRVSGTYKLRQFNLTINKPNIEDSYFMFGIQNNNMEFTPFNVHFVVDKNEINGGDFILPECSEMYDPVDDPTPYQNIFSPYDYIFENTADDETVDPVVGEDKYGYDYMQITQMGNYCVFPVGFEGKDKSSSSTLEVWISPNNGTAVDSYIHVGNIKAQYSSSDSHWHFTYTPVSTPSGWNVTALQPDITGISKEQLINNELEIKPVLEID